MFYDKQLKVDIWNTRQGQMKPDIISCSKGQFLSKQHNAHFGSIEENHLLFGERVYEI